MTRENLHCLNYEIWVKRYSENNIRSHHHAKTLHDSYVTILSCALSSEFPKLGWAQSCQDPNGHYPFQMWMWTNIPFQ